MDHMHHITEDAVPVGKVLAGAAEVDLGEVVILGHTKDGDFYFAASEASGPDVLWLLEYAKKKLLEIVDEQ